MDSLPYEIIYCTHLDSPVPDILSFCETAPFAHRICSDANFWREKAIKHLRIPLEYFESFGKLSWPHLYIKAEEMELYDRMEHIQDPLYRSLIDRLEDLRTEEELEPNLYFSNIFTEEDDSFGLLSINREIAVMASNDIIGGALLRLLRYHIEGTDITFHNDILREVKVSHLFNMDRFIDRLGQKENLTIYSPSAIIPSPIGNKIIDNIDIFTMKRIIEKAPFSM